MVASGLGASFLHDKEESGRTGVSSNKTFTNPLKSSENALSLHKSMRANAMNGAMNSILMDPGEKLFKINGTNQNNRSRKSDGTNTSNHSMKSEEEDDFQLTAWHARSVIDFAIAVLDMCTTVTMPNNKPCQVRIGIHSGDVCSGVVGTRMPRWVFAYSCSFSLSLCTWLSGT